MNSCETQNWRWERRITISLIDVIFDAIAMTGRLGDRWIYSFNLISVVHHIVKLEFLGWSILFIGSIRDTHNLQWHTIH